MTAEPAPAGVLRREATYIDLTLWALDRFPDRIAFIEGGQEHSYREVRDRLFRFARALQVRGFGKGDGAMVLSANRMDALLAGLAARILGGWSGALHPLGSAEDHAFVVSDSGARAFVFDPAAYEDRAREVLQLAAVSDRLALGPSEVGDDLLAAADGLDASPFAAVAEIDDVCSMTYSGGTTGRPKGVVQRHRTVVEMNQLINIGWQLPEDLRFLAVTPISHAASCFVLPTLLRGGTVILQNGFDPAGFYATVARHRVTATFMVPTMIYALLDHPATAEADVSSLETIVYGAAPMSPSRLEEALGVFGRVFVQLYGQSEAPATVTALRKEEHRAPYFGSCGRPLPGVDVSLQDDDGRQVATGEVGEICVRGRIVSDGYWQLPELTAETMRGEWLHTGDLARADEEGFLYIVDRKKDMIVSGGFNVFPREIEDVITEDDRVAMCVVIGVPDDKWGEAVKACVVARPGAALMADELIALVRERKGPIYAPKSVDIVDELPLTALGKPDRKQLRARYWAGEGRMVH